MGPNQGAARVRPDSAFGPNSADKVSVFDFETIDTCSIEMNEQPAHQDSDGLYVSFSSIQRRGRSVGRSRHGVAMPRRSAPARARMITDVDTKVVWDRAVFAESDAV